MRASSSTSRLRRKPSVRQRETKLRVIESDGRRRDDSAVTNEGTRFHRSGLIDVQALVWLTPAIIDRLNREMESEDFRFCTYVLRGVLAISRCNIFDLDATLQISSQGN
jgi:hypothetical protein